MLNTIAGNGWEGRINDNQITLRYGNNEISYKAILEKVPMINIITLLISSITKEGEYVKKQMDLMYS